jgi:hypothetical protein
MSKESAVYASSRSIWAIGLSIDFDLAYCQLCQLFRLWSDYTAKGYLQRYLHERFGDSAANGIPEACFGTAITVDVKGYPDHDRTPEPEDALRPVD